MESIRIKQVEFKENLRAFFSWVELFKAGFNKDNPALVRDLNSVVKALIPFVYKLMIGSS